jgi:hypothetical protein
MTSLVPAKTMEEVWHIFNPANEVNPDSSLYIQRAEDGLKKLTFDLKLNPNPFHGFLCGHVGSGKTTELMRLNVDAKINEKYFPIYITAQSFTIESINLTHDALLVEMGRQLIAATTKDQLDRGFEDDLNKWGRKLVDTFITDASIKAEVGAKASAWFAYFKAQLSSRHVWQHQEKLVHEPKVQDLIAILDLMAKDLQNKTGKRLLVMIDDLEKGSSDGDKAMHHRLFTEYYGVLTQPKFNIVYTLPVYFKALPTKRLNDDLIYSFSSVRIYDIKHKSENRPPLDKDGDGYALIKDFIEQRIDPSTELFDKHAVDELIRIGGGLFRDTARVIRDAAYFAIMRKSDIIEGVDVEKVFNKIKKEYQPIIRGKVVGILKAVANCDSGWVDGVEPYLQSRAVVEYENGEIWLDVRYVLKAYLQSLPDPE